MTQICSQDDCTCNHHKLLNFIQKGINEETKCMLQKLKNTCDMLDKSGSSWLHYSVLYGNVEITQYLIEKRYNVNTQSKSGITPLMLAVSNEDAACVEVLLKNNADIYLTDYLGASSLQIAVQKRFDSPTLVCLKQNSHRILEMFFGKVDAEFSSNSRRIVQLLLEANGLVTLAAVVFGNIELTSFLLRNGYPIGYREPSRWYTALHYAITFAKIEKVKFLIDRGACVDAAHSIASSPLTCYMWNCEAVDENSELLKTLLKRLNRLGKVDLEYLLKCGNKETVKTLLQSGINFNTMRFRNGKTFLHLLIENQNYDVLGVLDNYDIKYHVDSCDSCGRTPLMKAIQIGCVDRVRFLLERGARINLTLFNGRSLLFYACTEHEAKNTIYSMIIVKTLSLRGAVLTNEDIALLDRGQFTETKALSAEVIVAHLALLKVLNHSAFTDVNHQKIQSNREFQTQFDLRTRELEAMKNMEVHERVTLFDLFSESDRKMMLYARNERFMIALENYTMGSGHDFSFYYKTILKEKIRLANDKIELYKVAARAIERLTGLCSDVYHVILYQIIDYLEVQDLMNLGQLESNILKLHDIKKITAVFRNFDLK